MVITAQSCELESILALRDMYRLEMSCQIIHDSIHSRAGWTQEYSLRIDECGGRIWLRCDRRPVGESSFSV